MDLLELAVELQTLSPNAQVFFVVCSFVVIMYLITIMAFYPDAACRIREIVREWQHWQANKRRDNSTGKEASNE